MLEDSLIYVSYFTYIYIILDAFSMLACVYSAYKRDGLVYGFLISSFMFSIGFLSNLNVYHPQW